jgi:tetratricopeptide (TPR) repeat protein
VDAGDLTTARDYLTLGARRDRDAWHMPNLEHSLHNLAGCLGLLGLVDPAREVAVEALASSIGSHDADGVRFSHVYLGWLAGLTGDAAAAEEHFTAADQLRLTDLGVHLYSFSGVLWARWLSRTGRPRPAWDLTLRNVSICRRQGLNNDLARCDQVLGSLALSAGDTVAAGRHLTAAVTVFRDADYLTELVEALTSLAACAQATGDLDAAERHLAEALTIATPRGLIPARATALAVRARLRAAQATATGNIDALAQAATTPMQPGGRRSATTCPGTNSTL